MDCVVLDTFIEAKQLLGSKVEYLTLDVNELSARRLGYFDIVLFFGVLYHLRHPLLGLEKVVELSTDLAFIESCVIPPESRPIPAPGLREAPPSDPGEGEWIGARGIASRP